jgi:hypothetical protein
MNPLRFRAVLQGPLRFRAVLQGVSTDRAQQEFCRSDAEARQWADVVLNRLTPEQRSTAVVWIYENTEHLVAEVRA